ncbi:MAG TPA: MFS transporter [Bacilli bacterium]|nr:MFS transporter [Bacilli bacterium]
MSVRKSSNFWWMLTGRSVSKLGDTFTFLALSLMIFARTGSALSVGQMMVATYLPVLLLGPVAGVWVDRLNKRVLAIVCEVLRAGVVLAIPFVPDVAYIYGLAFLSATIGFFSKSAQGALVPTLFPKDDLRSYNAKIQTAVETMGIAGPVLAGLVIGFWSYQAAFVVDSLTFVYSAVALVALQMVKPDVTAQARMQTATAAEGASDETEPAPAEKKSFWAELAGGARYMAGHARIRNVTVIMFTAMIVSGMFNVLLVVFSKDIIRVSDQQFGWLEAGIGVGLATGAWLMNYGKNIDLLTFVRVAAVIDGLLISVLGLTGSFWAELATLVGIGIFSVIMMIAATTLMQTEAEEEYMGRVLSFYQTVFMGGTVASMMLAGWVEQYVSVPDIFVYGGLFTAAATFLLGLRKLSKPAVEAKA